MHWQTALEALPTALQQKIKLVPLDQLDLTETIFKRLINLCAIDATGALLIRPDGHVAWRKKQLITGESIDFNQLFEQLYFQNSLQNKTTLSS